MSVSLAQSTVNSCRRELDRVRTRQAGEEAKAAGLEREAISFEQQAAQSSSARTVRNKLQSAQRKRAGSNRAREAAAKTSKTVVNAQKKFHAAQARLAKEIATDEREARDKQRQERDRAERARQAEERRQRRSEQETEAQMGALHGRADDLELRLRAAPSAQAPAQIDVLFIAASPEDEQSLRLDKEVREIQQHVRMSDYRESIRFHYRPAAQVTDLLQALNEVRPHIVHFSGHGSQDALIFEDADGRAKALSNSDLARLLRISSDRIRLAVFNSCHSAHQASRACDHIDAAIGMEHPVDDQAARGFARQFYSALGFGKSLREAFEQATLQVKLLTGSTNAGPQLDTASGIDPAHVYLVRPAQDDHAV